MTQERLAEIADINVRTLRRLEAADRDPQLTTLVKIRKALGCSWSDLMPDSTAEPPLSSAQSAVKFSPEGSR